MDITQLHLPKLTQLPTSLPVDGAISMVLVQGVPAFRASTAALERLEQLLEKEQTHGLNEAETAELAQYEEVDDYLSYLNRMVRNLQSR